MSTDVFLTVISQRIVKQDDAQRDAEPDWEGIVRT